VFCHARWTEQHNIAAFMEEASRGQLIDDTLIERRLLVELEIGQMFLIGQVGELQV